MAEEDVGLAVVGLGYWGPNLLRNFATLPSVAVRMACDNEEEACARQRARYPEIQFSRCVDDVLENDSVEAVALATPASTHVALATQILEAGKHVLVEKPLATTGADAQALIAAAKAAGRVLMVGHTFEYNLAVIKLKEVSKDFGFGRPIYCYSTRVNLGRIRQDANAMWNLAPHDISILLFLLDEFPVAVTAQGRAFVQSDLHDVVFMFLEFPSGAVAHVHVSWLDPSKVRRTTLVGEGRMAVYDDLDPEAKVKVYDKGVDTWGIPHEGNLAAYAISLRAGNILCPKIDWKEPLAQECAHFVECIRSGTTPRTDGKNGYRVTKVLEAAQQSLDAGGSRVEIEE
jgi:predicted dehydrogenase